MKNRSWAAVCVILFMFLLETGCQAVQKQGAPAETVIVENKAVCEFLYLQHQYPGITVLDPELTSITRGFMFKFAIDCGDPYLNGDYITIVDYWEKDNVEGSTGMVEGVTAEGGVWKGTSVQTSNETIQHDYSGEGKYKGLKLTFVFDATDSTVDYRVTRVNEQ
jgi:hypothetical protein